jgi:AraC family transcriptional regulator, transcriptional activator of pobA
MGWFPWRDDMRLDLAAGAQGTHLLLGAGTLGRVLQHRPEEPELRFSAGRMAVVRLDDDGPRARWLPPVSGASWPKPSSPARWRRGSRNPCCMCLLVQFHRGQVRGQAGEGTGQSTLAARFTALVEAHFRDRWTVARYAAALGVSRDRLNDICQRAHGRSSARLIRDRLVLEARIYLESSSLTLDQIAAALGFASAAQFNTFFRQMEDRPPGRYRADQYRAARAGQARLSAPYDWP